MSAHREALIVSAVRTPVGRGKAGGGLSSVHPIDLSAAVLRAALERAGVEPARVDDVILGCAMPESTQGLNIARLALLRAGVPVEVPGATVNRFCASGLQAIAMAAQSIICDMADVVIAGGVELMSSVPMSGHRMRLHPELTDAYIGMGHTAERVAERYAVSRAAQDAWAARSHARATAAREAGRFRDEIVPVGPLADDELIRPETTIERLATLRPAFREGGSVTAGNSSPFSDGAAALLLVSREACDELGLTPLARFVGFAVAGVEPDVMGVGPIRAVPMALARASMGIDEIDLVELNEAFAAQVSAVCDELELDPELVNVNGGAIALGHPLGATGAKLTAQLVHELARRGGGMGLVTMCVGGGMGAAGIFEVYNRSERHDG